MRINRSLANVVLAVTFLLLSLSAFAESIGKVTHLEGVLAVQRDGTSKLLAVDSDINEGDVLTTQPAAFARIQFIDKGEVALRPNTVFEVKEYRFEEGSLFTGNVVFNLIKGGLRSVTGLIAKRRKQNFQLTTPVAIVGIRGTYFGLLYCASKKDNKSESDCDDIKDNSGKVPRKGLHADVTTGAISLTNDAGELVVHEGEYAYVEHIDSFA